MSEANAVTAPESPERRARRVRACMGWLVCRPVDDVETAARVAVLDGSGGPSDVCDPHLTSATRNLDMHRAATLLTPFLSVGALWLHSTPIPPRRDVWCEAFRAAVSRANRGEWQQWERDHGLAVQFGHDGRFRKWLPGEHTARSWASIQAYRAACAEGMADILGPSW